MSATPQPVCTDKDSMGLLDFDDTYVPPFSPKRTDRTPNIEENFAALQNLGHEKMSEDFEDSPHADRKPIHGAGSGCPIEMCGDCRAQDERYD